MGVEFDSTIYPHIEDRIDFFRVPRPDFETNVIPGAEYWVAYDAVDAFR